MKATRTKRTILLALLATAVILSTTDAIFAHEGRSDWSQRGATSSRWGGYASHSYQPHGTWGTQYGRYVPPQYPHAVSYGYGGCGYVPTPTWTSRSTSGLSIVIVIR